MKYDYTFALKFVGGANLGRHAYKVLAMLLERTVTLPLTEVEFEEFRRELFEDGFKMTEISRVPHHVPELVL